MATTIEVNKQSVKQLLESGKDNPFVIPEYQRPYAWNEDQIITLFNDLLEFTEEEVEKEEKREGTYFLGSIVSYENEAGQQEIIDGQQRITSLFLLLRAIYTKLQGINAKSKEKENFINQIEPTIWKQNKLTGSVDHSNILLTSKVVNNEGNQVLKSILETGKTFPNAQDNYSKNYRQLESLFEDLSLKNPLLVYNFIYYLLNKAILLPIKADNQETALTIFSTLNDRGLPLSDADIFKAKIYNGLNTNDKKDFIEQWQQLDERAKDAQEGIQQLFYYYMFYLRAQANDRKTTTPGLRKYFSQNKFEKLQEENLLDKLDIILNLWSVVNKRISINEEPWSQNQEILKALDTLSSYPNEFWKYPVVIYYLKHRGEENFEYYFLKFLRKLVVELSTKYIISPTINSVKTDILKLNSEIFKSPTPLFKFKDISNEELQRKLKIPHRNIVRMLLKALAYNNQDELLPERWEIEHILPQKWHDNYFADKNDDDVKEKIEHLGNKVPFEKRLNITAGNGYFDKKKVQYRKSEVAITKELSELKTSDWKIDSIIERDIRISDELLSLFESWNNEYKKELLADDKSVKNKPSEEELHKIKEFKDKGWI